ncbi:MAG: aminopeptidase N [Pseudomonadales bacterium]|nr:aminopeptidase N [Pseudomonadales bacterium]
MKDAQARTTYLKDYQPPNFLIDSTDLEFDLYEDHATVVSRLQFRLNPASKSEEADTLVLHGHDLVLEKLLLDGKELTEQEYLLADEQLTIPRLSELLARQPTDFQLECHTRIEPQNNTALEGLYKSKKMFCTQCEAEGFRRITYYLDRPDVMSSFITKISADKTRYPILLSNGNNVGSGAVDSDSSRHWVQWEDPFKKPSYLFALVAGDLVSLDDSFTTCSGREIALQIFVEAKDLDKCDHAMLSLKNAMGWDEEIYGREYDLDIFMIVAVDDFNMGAMENKGLNIFNTSCVLANPLTTTDLAFQRVEAVVAHEYFHNWSGNRVTCRDWFQLSLKEGFTVFRDSEFSADMGSRTVKRVEDVAFLKTVQFAEDGGPMAHSVRPDSYMEISNFYTVTIYEKGAEVVRMISQILGPDNFRKGSDLYFDRHDGQAVTTEDFVLAMEEASGIDLRQFRRWYSQAGTPTLNISGDYNETENTFTLMLEQDCSPTPGQAQKEPFLIPLKMGLLDQQGNELELKVKDRGDLSNSKEVVLPVTDARQKFVFENISERPIPSLLRSFSAPVRMQYPYAREDLYFLMVHDSDGFNRWNASQLLAIEVLDELQVAESPAVPEIAEKAFEGVLQSAVEDAGVDQAMLAHLLALPTEGFLIEQATVADVDSIHKARESLANHHANKFKASFAQIYENNNLDEPYQADAPSIARRALKNLALGYLVRTEDEALLTTCYEQFSNAVNMTDQAAALRCLVNSSSSVGQSYGQQALESFYEQWQHEPLVVDQWFAIQATCQIAGNLERVKSLLEHEAFDIKNPNKVRSLIGAFCGQNHIGFHAANGEGYEFLADRILELDKLNPQIAARLLTPLTRWRKFDSNRQALMQAQLQRIKACAELSKDAYEVVEKSKV